MAHLGTIPAYTRNEPVVYKAITKITPRLPGFFLGAIAVYTPAPSGANYRRVDSYRYRQEAYIYKPIWVRYGQRWPQGQSTF